jgi:hypothetical protein
VVVADEVEESVNDQMRHMRFQRLSGKSRLGPHGFRGKHDIAEERPRRLRKRQHVGRLVLAAILGVQPPDRRIIGEENA